MENKKEIIFRKDLVKREELLYLKFTNIPFTGEYQYLGEKSKELCITKCKDGYVIGYTNYYANGQLESQHTFMKKFGNSKFIETVQFSHRDIERHPAVTEVLSIYGDKD